MSKNLIQRFLAYPSKSSGHHENLLVNKIYLISQYSSSFSWIWYSSPSKHQLKSKFHINFFGFDCFAISIDFEISFIWWKLSRSRGLTKPTFCIRTIPGTTSQVAGCRWKWNLTPSQITKPSIKNYCADSKIGPKHELTIRMNSSS